MVFTQFGVAALAVAVVHILEAASRHPPITKVAAALFFAIAGKHCSCRHACLSAPFIDTRSACWHASGHSHGAITGLSMSCLSACKAGLAGSNKNMKIEGLSQSHERILHIASVAAQYSCLVTHL